MPARKIPLVWKGPKDSEQIYFKYNPATQNVVRFGCDCAPPPVPCDPPNPVTSVVLSTLTSTGGNVTWTYGGPETIIEVNIYESATLPVNISGTPIFTDVGTFIPGNTFSFTTTDTYYYVASIRTLKGCPDGVVYSTYAYSEPVQYNATVPCTPPDPVESVTLSNLTATGGDISFVYSGPETQFYVDIYESPTLSVDRTPPGFFNIVGALIPSGNTYVFPITPDYYYVVGIRVRKDCGGGNEEFSTYVYSEPVQYLYEPTWTFTARESNRNWYDITSSADGTKLVAVVRLSGQIYTSTDSGVSWTPRESNRDWRGIASSADGTKLVAVVDGGQIYTSTDSGVSWTPRESNRNWYGVASSSDGTKLVAVVRLSGQIYTSTDSGVSWTPRESNRNWYGVASSSDGTKLVAVVFGGRIYTSTDSGVSWTPRESNKNWWGITSSADGTILAATPFVTTFGESIYISTDSGVTWTPKLSDTLWEDIACSSDGTKIVAAAGDFYAGIWMSEDSGTTWVHRQAGINYSGITSSSDGLKIAAIVIGGQIYTGVFA